MSSIERYLKRISKDTAVYWSNPTAQADGSPQYDDPIEIACFWRDETDLIKDTDGKEIAVRARVYIAQDLDDQGMLFHGNLGDLDSGQEEDPRKIEKAYEIKKLMKIPSLHLRGQFNRIAIV